jgi:hypothetical protein
MGRNAVERFIAVVVMWAGVAVGTAHAQFGPPPPDADRAVAQAKAMNESLNSQFDAMATFLTVAFFGIIGVGAIVGIVIGTRWYLAAVTRSSRAAGGDHGRRDGGLFRLGFTWRLSYVGLFPVSIGGIGIGCVYIAG